jgi:hypothetical protein
VVLLFGYVGLIGMPFVLLSYDNWSQVKMEHLVWDAFLDHARTAWYQTKWMIKQQPWKMASVLAAFDKVWMLLGNIGRRQGLKVHWNFAMPDHGMINWS